MKQSSVLLLEFFVLCIISQILKSKDKVCWRRLRLKKLKWKHYVWLQRESFSSESDAKKKALQIYRDDKDVISVKVKIVRWKNSKNFLKPIVLPSKYEIVKRLVFYIHAKNCHAGLQILLNLLRKKYWILNERMIVKLMLASCNVRTRFNSK